MINSSKYRVLTNTNKLNYAQWLQCRKKGIGGSDAGAIINLNKYKTPLDVYLDKTSDYVEEQTPSEASYWGNTLEKIVALEFAKRTGKKIKRKNAILQSLEYPHMLANIDRDIVNENAILECKTASEYLKSEWEDDNVPQSYIAQCQHYMAVTGCEKVYIAVLIGGNKFNFKEINRDDDIINYLIEKEADFWQNHVLKNNPPFTEKMSGESLIKLFPKASENVVKISEHYNDEIQLLLQLKQQKKELEENITNIENKLKSVIGENKSAKTTKYTLNWTNSTIGRFNTKNFQKLYPSLYDGFKVYTNTRRFTVKENSI